ncbi:MAG: HD domain-containing protein [Clostridia bacterium]|nr:HD domain-containing protein [Clostridia bacterium]
MITLGGLWIYIGEGAEGFPCPCRIAGGWLMFYKLIKARESESVYEIKGKGSSIVKKYHDDVLQVSMYNLSENRVLYIDPVESDDSYKTYYILSGSCMIFETEERLYPGDLFIYKHRSEVQTLKTLEPCTIMVHATKYDAYKTIQDTQDTINRLLGDIQAKDHYTGEHSMRVYELVKNLAIRMGYKAKELNNITKAAYYHDLGKIFIDDEILNKPDLLTADEFESIKLHVTLSRELVMEHFNEKVFEIIEQHHERLNGRGYPKGLTGDDILMEAKILAVCDSFDAMITDRVYKKGKGLRSRARSKDYRC